MLKSAGAPLTETTDAIEQPSLFVKVIVALPSATPVTTPVLLTVAILVAEDVHGFELLGVPDPDKIVVAEVQAVNVPLIAGNAFTVAAPVAIVFVVAPVEVTEILPEAVFEAALVNRTYIVDVLMVPPLCVSEIDELKVPPLEVLNS